VSAENRSDPFAGPDAPLKLDREDAPEILQLIIEQSRAAIYLLVGKQFPIINQRFEELFGVSRREANSPEFDFMDLVAPESRPLIVERAEAYGRGEAIPNDYEFTALTAEGRRLEVFASTVRVSFRGQEGTLGILRDITAQKEAAEALRASEEKYRTLVERANDGIVILQGDTIAFANSQAAALTGFDVEELPGRSFVEAIPPEYRDTLIGRYTERLDGERVPALYETEILHRDGTRIPVEVNAGRISYGSQPADMIILRDLTSRREAEARLRESEAERAMILDSVNELIAFQDTELRIVWANRTAIESAGLTAEEIIGRHCYEIWPGSSEPCENCPVERAMATGRSEKQEITTPDGRVWFIQGAPVIDEDGTVTGAVETTLEITDLRRAEEALRESETSLRTLFETMVEGVAWVTPDGGFVRANQAAEEILRLEKLPDGNVYDTPRWELIGEDELPLEENQNPCLLACSGTEPIKNMLVGVRHPEGDLTWINLSITPVSDGAGAIQASVWTFFDVTERKLLERQLFQSQKMEAVGRLAGGIAHDFNNILTVISGNAQLGIMRLKEADPLGERLQTILQAAGHAEDLTRRLLAFSRRQITSPRTLDLNEILEGLQPMLERLLGEDVKAIFDLTEERGAVTFDPTQLEQMLVNLVVNARDAMPEGGTLTIGTGITTLDAAYARIHPYVEPGQYVFVAVSDTGTGMTEDIKDHIFEPFFTTKEDGTGLGLATVYGIVKQSGGSIELESTTGEGTTFTIFLPLADETPESYRQEEFRAELPWGSETILLVEDEEGVRTFAAETLGELGYIVHDFAAPEDALAFCRTGEIPLDLILSDVVMPGSSGSELVQDIQQYHPDTPVLYMSGYTDDHIVRQGILDDDVEFIPKPFTPYDLARRVRDILDD